MLLKAFEARSTLSEIPVLQPGLFRCRTTCLSSQSSSGRRLALNPEDAAMTWFTFPAAIPLCRCLSISVTVWFTLLLVFTIVPAVLGVSLGVRRFYMRTLLKLFEWATSQMEMGAKEKNQQLYKPYSNGIIAKEPPLSLQQGIQGLRGSASCLRSEPEFEMADIFYFCRSGVDHLLFILSTAVLFHLFLACSFFTLLVEEGEDAVQFANRVKAAIAAQGGLVDLIWDGALKRAKVKEAFKEEQQKLYSKVLVGEQNQGGSKHSEDENPGG